jgi:hypothetical protein
MVSERRRPGATFVAGEQQNERKIIVAFEQFDAAKD